MFCTWWLRWSYSEGWPETSLGSIQLLTPPNPNPFKIYGKYGGAPLRHFYSCYPIHKWGDDVGVHNREFKGCWDSRDHSDDSLEVFSFLRHPPINFLNLGQNEPVGIGNDVIVSISLGKATVGGHVVHALGEFLVFCLGSGIFLFEFTHALHHGLQLLLHCQIVS